MSKERIRKRQIQPQEIPRPCPTRHKSLYFSKTNQDNIIKNLLRNPRHQKLYGKDSLSP